MRARVIHVWRGIGIDGAIEPRLAPAFFNSRYYRKSGLGGLACRCIRRTPRSQNRVRDAGYPNEPAAVEIGHSDSPREAGCSNGSSSQIYRRTVISQSGISHSTFEPMANGGAKQAIVARGSTRVVLRRRQASPSLRVIGLGDDHERTKCSLRERHRAAALDPRRTHDVAERDRARRDPPSL